MRAAAFSFIAVVAAHAAVHPAAATPADVLAANKAASGGGVWDRAGTLSLDFAYAGQGLTGHVHTRYDLSGRGFFDSYTIGPQSGASGFDGTNAWQQESSGTVTDQKGGDVLPLAFNEAYRDGNLWWRDRFGGASVADNGRKTDAGTAYDVLNVTPGSGKPFEAWFDTKTHLLARTVEVQGSQTITTFYSDYAPFEGFEIARKVVIDDGTGVPNRQTQTLTQAKLLPPEQQSAFAQPKAELHDFSIAHGATETTVPFRLINNHIYADVSVNGSKPLLFIFDTGGHSILAPATAKDLAIAAKGSLTTTGGGAGFAQSGVTRVASLSVGNATITDQPVSVLDVAPSGVEGVDERGMIGYEFFARFVTRIDYGAHTITFIDRNHFDPKDAGTAIPFVLYNQLPQVSGSYNGIPGRFCIDTGARMTLSLTGPFVAAHDLRAQATGGIEAMTGWGVGGPSRSFVTRGGTMQLGQVAIAHPLVMMSTDKGGSDAFDAFGNNVGGGVLKRFVVTLDYAHTTMYLKPVPGPLADLDTFDRSGMWINADTKGFKIIDVTKGGPAEAAGLKTGDILTAVDGTSAKSIALYDLRARLRNDAPGTAVIFSVNHGARTKNVTVTLRDLI